VPTVLKSLSQHYVTKKRLDDAIITKIVASQNFEKARLLQHQCLLSLLSLESGCAQGCQDMHILAQQLYKKVCIDIEYDERNYFETTCKELILSGSAYYTHVWSQVLAAGLFEYVLNQGITDHLVGQKLYDMLLSHGANHDPYQLISMLCGKNVTKQALLNSLKP
jgi:Zn-dependent oligopeptidase